MAIMLCTNVARAEGIAVVTPETMVMEVGDLGTHVAAQRRNLQLEVPGTKEGSSAVLQLRGAGLGPDFNWTVLTIRNTGPEKRTFILAVDSQRLTASGMLQLRRFGSQLASVQWLPDGPQLTPQASGTADAFRFDLEAGDGITVGLEGPAVLSGARIYDFGAYTQRESSLAFLRGAALAVVMVLAFGILALFGIRSNRVFPVGSFFAFAVLLFIALEAGYCDSWAAWLQDRGYSLQYVRAVVESLLALATGFLLWGLTSLNRRSWYAEAPYALVLVGLAALVVFSFINPDQATRTARWAMLALVIAGFVVTLLVSRGENRVMSNALLFWSAFLIWIFAAATAIMSEIHTPFWHAIILTGLTILVGLLGFAATRLAFAQGFLSKPYLTDASRRSLALTGAQHYLWDWQPVDGVLDVGIELARSLGHKTEGLNPRNAARWFAAMLHPSDDMAYRKSLDLNTLPPNSFVEHELRLRDVKGEYHWFVLRARSLPGAAGLSSRLIGTLTDITRSKQSEDKLITESIHDPVTSLPTRALFMDRLEREIATPLAVPRRVLMVGIERFKILNEGLGHELGDQLLLAAGQRLSNILRTDESVARLSGSRFAVMFVERVDGRSAAELADLILSRLAEPVKVMNQEVYLSACVGISLSSEDYRSAAVLLQQAETALHEAQSQGPRTVEEFHEEIEDDRASNMALEQDLRRAIDRAEIEVHYQPIVNLLTREVAGFEALARWRHPRRGLLPPSDFIGMAEQAGLINEVGNLVLAEAIRQMGIWQRVLTRNSSVYMAINVSADQLSDTGFIDRVNALIAREGVLPYAVKIEITESVVMRYPERARQLVRRLRTMGIGVACDDFGTGFSNLASLRELAFDTLKMDRSFLADSALDGRGGIILQSVVNMAHSLGMAVVAEGIESEEQARSLVALGCELGQGYVLGQPMPPREVHGMLAVLPRQIEQSAQIAYQQAPVEPLAEDAEWEDEVYEPESLPSLFDVYAARDSRGKKPVKKTAKKKPKPKAKAATKSKGKTKPRRR
jgi:diguanylate cyclase (GGDEF)-like protein